MLRELSINNIALIDSLTVEFDRGLNILSGETGAGKSIIIDSLAFVLGGRADKSLIRYGESEAKVEAEFTELCDSAIKKLDEYEIDYTEGLIVSRIMSSEGRNICRVNGIKVSTSTLRDITGTLVDIYGQHENSVLLNTDNHIEILDSFDKSIDNAKADYYKCYIELRNTDKAIKNLGTPDEISKKISDLQNRIERIEKAKIKPGEENELEKKLELLEAREEIVDGLSEAREALFDDGCGIDSVNDAIRALEKIKNYNSEYNDCYERLTNIEIDLEDISAMLSKLKAGNDYDEYESERINARLDMIRELIMDYGKSEQDVIDALKRLKNEFEIISNAEYDIAELSDKRKKLYKELKLKAEKLTDTRRQSAIKFDNAVLEELAELGMKNTKFAAEITSVDIERSDKNGVDSVEFMISPNPGQPLKPLSKIVSGGEMSRLMLAIKKITADIDGVNVMIFDEIDTGISGYIADVVAKKLYDISVSRQVLAITHLPQLASMADRHYLIAKTSTDSSTSTGLVMLDRAGMIREVARLAGGGDSAAGIAHAEEMKANADKYKSK